MTPPFRRDDRLVTANPQPLGQRVPEPLHTRVEQLCDRAHAAGELRRPTTMEMVAAILLAASTDPQELRQMLHQYGAATVADALVEETGDDENVVELPRRKSGPRR